jgi:hypothetical protein
MNIQTEDEQPVSNHEQESDETYELRDASDYEDAPCTD